MDPHYAYMQTMSGTELRWAYGWLIKKKLRGKWVEERDRKTLTAVVQYINLKEGDRNEWYE